MGFMEYGAAYGTTVPRPPINFEAIRADNPVSSIAGKTVKLIRAGKEWRGCCPFHPDRSPSFTIFKDDRRFHCFGCGAAGDVLDFVEMLHKVGTREAAEMLGASSLPTVESRSPPARVEPERDTTGEALAIWDSATPIAETPAEAYLRRRGITMPLPPSLRFSRLRYGFRGALHPTLIAAICNPAGAVIGIQRTYLTEEGGKAAFEKVKLSLGRVRGGSIQLAPASASLVVTEGLEDGLTLAQEIDRPVWIAAGTTFLPSIVFPDVVSSIVIGADNDGAGETAARKAAASYAAGGRAVSIMRPSASFKDFNAELLAVTV
jgi:DNA primase